MGEAGTGKTVLAVERAKRLVGTGQRTLLLCHRASVAAFMRTSIGTGRTLRLDVRQPSELTVTPFGELLDVLAAETGKPRPQAQNKAASEALLAAADELGLSFDALVVDEAQEFTPDHLEALVLLLNDPDADPVYLFADPFQHSAMLSAAMVDRHLVRGRYNWVPPDASMPLITLVDNVRNSEPIARTVRPFLLEQRSAARTAGPPPEVIQKPRNQLAQAAIDRVKRLLDEDGFKANQLLVVCVGIDKGVIARAAGRAPLDIVDVRTVTRFPLPPTDLRVALGAPDDVQGLEAEVTVVVHAGDRLSVGDVRDLYVAASRARSHLVLVSSQPLQRLTAAAKKALAAASDEH